MSEIRAELQILVRDAAVPTLMNVGSADALAYIGQAAATDRGVLRVLEQEEMKMRVSLTSVLFAGCVLAGSAADAAHADIIVNDSWADGGRDNGPDPLDSNWWTSSSPLGIEVSVGSLGMVTGSSGRGIHTIFPTQTLVNVGDKVIATYTFTTPQTVLPAGPATFRVGLFDTLGRVGLDADVVATSSSPNALYGWGTGTTPPGPGTAGLPGYMMDMEAFTGSEDLNFRQHDSGTVIPTGRLLGTLTGFMNISPSGPDGAYTIVPNTTYTGSVSVTRISLTELQVAGSLGSATHSVIDVFDSTSFGMLAFWANSNVFGVSNVPGEINNGIDFTHVTIEFIPGCPGDVDASGSVDVDDLIAVILSWGDCPKPPAGCPADIDDNGTADVDDLIAVILAWGACE